MLVSVIPFALIALGGWLTWWGVRRRRDARPCLSTGTASPEWWSTSVKSGGESLGSSTARPVAAACGFLDHRR
ncbi:hypothetical protein [Aeromicrobium sp. UC242_57]|uniref:hypothetical protein n=1 Tax=Aeromicrobium sp. UC242_57 TaxID=3374624 RepID=UPI0037BD3F4D